MFETLAAISIAAGFVFVIVLIAGPDTGEPVLTSLFANAPMPARPRGVQEMDLAPFAFGDQEPAAPGADQIRAIDGRVDSALAA